MVDDLRLVVGLCVICSAHLEGGTLIFEKRLPKVAHKDLVPIRDNRLGEPMPMRNLIDKEGHHRGGREGVAKT